MYAFPRPSLSLFLGATHHLPPLPPCVFCAPCSVYCNILCSDCVTFFASRCCITFWLCNIFCFALLYNVLRFSVCLDLAVCLLYILRIARRRPSQKIYSTYPSFPATRPRDVPLAAFLLDACHGPLLLKTYFLLKI